MLGVHWAAALLVIAVSWLRAEMVIENPKHLDVPEEQAQAVFLTTCRVLENEFHQPGALEDKFRVKLVLGQTPERFTIDDPNGNGTVYLERWNEAKFAASTMRLGIQHLLAPERQLRMVQDIVRRAHEIAPVSAKALGKQSTPSAAPRSEDPCIPAMTNPAIGRVPCGPVIPQSRVPVPMSNH